MREGSANRMFLGRGMEWFGATSGWGDGELVGVWMSSLWVVVEGMVWYGICRLLFPSVSARSSSLISHPHPPPPYHAARMCRTPFQDPRPASTEYMMGSARRGVEGRFADFGRGDGSFFFFFFLVIRWLV